MKKKTSREKKVVKITKPRKRKIGRRAVLLADARVRQMLIEMGGENTLQVLKEFTEEMSDDELARKAKLKVSEVRIVLNKLHSEGLVSYTRLRDKDSGWFSYIWRIKEEEMQKLLEKVKENKKEEVGEFYFCGKCGKEKHSFASASELFFRCPSCGESLIYFEK